MAVFIMTAIVFLLILIVLLGLAIGLGLLLHVLFPAVDLGLSMLIGLVATAISMHFAGRFLAGLPIIPEDVLVEADLEKEPPSPPPPSRSRTRRKRS